MIPSLESFKWIAGIAVILGMFGGGYWTGHHEEEQAFNLYKSEQVAAAEKAAATSQAFVRHKEENYATNTAAIQNVAQASIESNAASARAALSDMRTGTLRLSSQLASARAKLVYQASASAPGANTESASELPIDTAEFLVNESKRADDLAVRFNEAVDVIAQDRLTCDGSAPAVTDGTN